MITVTNYPVKIQVTATAVYRSEPTITDKFDDIPITDDVLVTIEDEVVNSFILNSFFRLNKRCKQAGKHLHIKCNDLNKAVFRLVGIDKVGVVLE